MEAKSRRTQAYELMLEVAAVPLAERAVIMIGAEEFFDRGWPINHFTVGMAARAGKGLVPPIYEGLGSEGRYFETMRPRADAVESSCQITTPESSASEEEDD